MEGRPLAVADASGRAVADVDLLAAREKNISSRKYVLGDRRPDVY
jgi:hypothetical protein